MATQVRRNPFARESLMRVRVRDSGIRTCCWCGNVGKQGLGGKRYLNRYVVSPDAGRDRLIDGEFCGIDCMRSYHGISLE